MRDHDEGGSYNYKHLVRTATPVFESKDVCTQTDESDEVEMTINASVKDSFGDLYFKTNHKQNVKEENMITNKEYIGDDIRDNSDTDSYEQESSSECIEQTIPNSDANKESEVKNSSLKLKAHSSSESIVKSQNCIDTRPPETAYIPSDCNETLNGVSYKKLYSLQNVQISLIKLDDSRSCRRKEFNHEEKSNANEMPRDSIQNEIKRKRDTNEQLLLEMNETDVNVKEEQDSESGNEFQEKQRRRPKKDFKKIECAECGKMFSSKYIRNHLVKFHNVPKLPNGRPKKDSHYTCETCNKRIRTNRRKVHGSTHMKKRNKSEEVSAVCEICGRVFVDVRSLLTHMQVHSVKRLTCKQCGHVSTSVEEREKHVKTHKKFHYCDTCGSKFSCKKTLQEHIKCIHQKIMKSVCDVCGRQFFAKNKMELHRATHFAPSLQCIYCDRKFCDPNALRRHVMIHTGDVKYTCHICNHGFIQSTPYWLHMQKRHSVSREEAMAIHKKRIFDDNERKAKFEKS